MQIPSDRAPPDDRANANRAIAITGNIVRVRTAYVHSARVSKHAKITVALGADTCEAHRTGAPFIVRMIFPNELTKVMINSAFRVSVSSNRYCAS